MEVATRKADGMVVATVKGDIDGSNAGVAQQQILGAIADGDKVVLDLTEVPYMSSAGLRMLLSTYRTVTNTGGKVVLVGVVDEIKDTMSVTGFLKFFTLTDTLDSAVTALKQ